MRLYIFGASGSGVTTLGRALAANLDCAYLDSDDYLWMPTDPPYTTKRDKAIRNALLTQDCEKSSNVVLGGSVASWKLDVIDHFDMAVFLYVPTPIRLQRIARREEQRFGSRLIDDPIVSKNFKGLLEWAGGYDDDPECGRSLSIHRGWISATHLPVLEIQGERDLADGLARVMEKIAALGLN